MVPRSSSPLRYRWLLSAAVFGVAVCLAELALRVLDLPPQNPTFLGAEVYGKKFVADDELFWRLAPRSEDVNAVGLRGWWPSGPKRDRELRIVCVGDSGTYGTKAGYEQAYGIRLERLLQRKFPGICVRTVLLALPGYSTYQNRVLVDKYLAFLAPDVTIFYCGSWNDFVPAVALSDAEYAPGDRVDALRVGRLIGSVLGGTDSAAGEELVAAFRRGEVPNGRRVPLPDFRDHLRAMIDRARALESDVVVVLPARPERTKSDYPIAERYSAALRDITGRGDSWVVDAQALFDAYLAGCPEPWGEREVDGEPLSILFADWIHPTALGHRLLAENLLETLRQFHVGEGIEAVAASALDIVEVVPEVVPALSPGSIVLQGAGLDEEGALERIWIDKLWIRSPFKFRFGQVRLDLPGVLRPGRRLIEISTLTVGSLRAEVLVEPPELDVQLSLRGNRLQISASLLGPAGWSTVLWLSAGRRSDPAPTVYGPFHLVADPDGRPPGHEEMLFRFERLQLPAYYGTVNEQGRWELHETSTVDPQAVSDLAYAQAGMLAPDGRSGVLTEVVELRPR